MHEEMNNIQKININEFLVKIKKKVKLKIYIIYIINIYK